jgi:hypothetical protein
MMRNYQPYLGDMDREDGFLHHPPSVQVPSVQFPLVQFPLVQFQLVQVERDFNRLAGFASSWLELPVTDGGDRTLGKDGVAALYNDGLHRAVGRYMGLELNDPVKVHGSSERRVDGLGLGYEFPRTTCGILRPGMNWNDKN